MSFVCMNVDAGYQAIKMFKTDMSVLSFSHGESYNMKIEYIY